MNWRKQISIDVQSFIICLQIIVSSWCRFVHDFLLFSAISAQFWLFCSISSTMCLTKDERIWWTCSPFKKTRPVRFIVLSGSSNPSNGNKIDSSDHLLEVTKCVFTRALMNINVYLASNILSNQSMSFYYVWCL